MRVINAKNIKPIVIIPENNIVLAVKIDRKISRGIVLGEDFLYQLKLRNIISKLIPQNIIIPKKNLFKNG